MDTAIRQAMQRLEDQADTTNGALGAIGEGMRTVIAQGAQIIRQLTEKDEPREGPSLEDLLLVVIKGQRTLAEALTKVEAGQAVIRNALGVSAPRANGTNAGDAGPC